MCRSRSRRTAIATAALLVTMPAVIASAEPAPSVGLAAAVERDLGISVAEFTRRAQLAERVALFAEDARQRYPRAFAGAWLENATPIAALTAGQGAEQARKAATAAGLTVRTAAKTEATLGQQKSAFEEWLGQQSDAVAGVVHGVAVDLVGNRIVVWADRAEITVPDYIDPANVIVRARAVAEPLPSGSAESGSLAAPPGALARDYWQNTPRTPSGAVAGGDPYVGHQGRRLGHCSLGFHAVDRSGAPVNITAGHCDMAAEAAGTPEATAVHEWIPGEDFGAALGAFEKSVFGGLDYGLIRVADAARDRFGGAAVREPGAADIRLDGHAIPVVGAPACKSGATTGYTCGVVLEVDVTNDVGGHGQAPVQVKGLFRTDICALPGDSGGPVITGTKALGISSNVTSETLTECPIREPITAGSFGAQVRLSAQPIAAVLAEHPELTLRTN
ncbi:S1 family peptidase [Nocardia sp. NPDC050406]|uniref:S1 family peptidase n=1 Tax=Nocardia sp. NPDC050406 TaxID=3364318 RepID=UPI0037A23BD0